jgi:hypothetical protein
MYGSDALRPSAAFALTQRWYEVPHARPLTVAVWSTPSLAGVQSVGPFNPYEMRELTGSLVCQAIVASNGESETVCTLEMTIGVVDTGVVDVDVGAVVVVSPPSVGLGSTAKVRGVELKVTIAPLGFAFADDCEGEDEKCDREAGTERGCRPGVSRSRAR